MELVWVSKYKELQEWEKCVTLWKILSMRQMKIVEPPSYVHCLHTKRFQKSFRQASTEEGGVQTGDSSPKLGKSISASSPLDETAPQPLSKATTTNFLLGSTYRAQIWCMVLLQCCNTLGNTVKRLCQDAGISGFKTNHSLRVTNATRLFQHGVDEQLIMTRTGHCRVSGVCAYNRVSDDQKETLSSNLNSTTNANWLSSTPEERGN